MTFVNDKHPLKVDSWIEQTELGIIISVNEHSLNANDPIYMILNLEFQFLLMIHIYQNYIHQ